VSGIQALVKKGNEGVIKTAADLKGKKVGVGLGTNYEEWLRQNVQGVDIRTYDDDPTKYQDLRVGRIDAILVDRLAALDLVKKTNNTLAVAGEAFSRQESGVALRKGNEDLLKAIDGAIADMQKDGSLKALSRNGLALTSRNNFAVKKGAFKSAFFILRVCVHNEKYHFCLS
jgi:cystine transport system substrate-binding protein